MEGVAGVIVRGFIAVLIDLLALVISTILALLLRANFEFGAISSVPSAIYVGATGLACAIAIPIFGVHKTIWRFSSMADYVRLLLVVFAVVVGAVVITFTVNRLDGVARSLPILQLFVGASILIGLRVAFRLRHLWREKRRPKNSPLKVVREEPIQNVLIVGLSRLTETYLQSVEELAPTEIKIAGLVGEKDRHVGRLMGNYKVLGRPEDIEGILADLHVHGIKVDTIVIAKEIASFSSKAREVVSSLERQGVVDVLWLTEQLGLSRRKKAQTSVAHRALNLQEAASFELSKDNMSLLARRPYWIVKRLFDVIGASILLVVFLPIMILLGLAVAVNVGTPIAFWQYRPGLGGRAFKLLKFRTMAPMNTSTGYPLTDDQRTSKFGNFLRRTRLDELPQLFSIITGEMSFVGPRPLLPRDQSDAYRARLLVRPGLTGWAQVVGGRAVSAEDKAALDVWYVQNASLLLDLKIIARTIPMVVFGEKTCRHTIEKTWHDLSRSGVLSKMSLRRRAMNGPYVSRRLQTENQFDLKGSALGETPSG